MADENKIETTSKKRTTTKKKEVDTNIDMQSMMAEMQKQILELQKQLNDSNKQVKEKNKETTDLQQLVNALKEKQEKQLPKKVKVMSLIPNRYNLTTEKDGHGKQFAFEDFGDIITMKTTELEDILSIQAYREQAEKGYFYILDKDIVDDQELTEYYEKISNKEALDRVMHLESDECVDIFVNLDKEMQDSIASKMAEMINDGIKLDRNKLADISMRTDIDIEKIANSFKSAKR